ncbi:hypothetical protein [Dysosmobacter sp.]|uniref:hypothetical protein n=1 Tax=Dysosmobacter sp. TaxID=2591382 RepID=UPI002A97CCA4|nr:hypothetical protein [Dysosmobacter sp.]MDY5612360.1 hypothetical protein [Dysosmobacter sp.]
MKKGAKITLGVVGVLVVAGAAAAAWQWNNLNALRYGLTMDKDTLDQQLEENQTVLNEAMDEYQISEYTFTDEEVSRLTDGTVTAQEAAQKLLEPPAQENGQSSQPAQPQQPPQADHTREEQEIRELIATMYVLRATYVGKLEAVAQSAIDEYVAGEHTPENRTRVVRGKLDELIAMEKECDGQVAAVVSRLRELLKATGQDDTLARQVEKTYKEEKSLKKAYYLNEFRNG